MFKLDSTDIKENDDLSTSLAIHGIVDESVKWDLAKKSLELISK